MQGDTNIRCPCTSDARPLGQMPERGVLVAGIMVLCCPVAGHAAEWSLVPAVAFGAGYETNATLTTDPHDSVSEAVLTPELTIRRRTETSTVNIGLWARATDYSGSGVEDTREGEVALSTFVQSTERTKLGLEARSRWDTLLESAVVGSGTGNIQDVDIGLVTTRVRRNWREVSPTMSYALTERGSVAFRYRLTDVKFGDVGTTGLVDYQQHYLSGTYSYRVTDTNSVDVTAEGSLYRPVAGNESNTTSLLAGVSHAFSPIADAGIQAGAGRTTETKPDGSQTDTSSFAMYAWATQRSELSTLNALISRNVQPSGSGRSVSAGQLRIFWNRKLTETTAFRLRMKVFRTKALEGSDPLADRRYGEGEMGVVWYWAPEWSINASYNYRNQKYDVNPDSAQSSGVFIELAWAPPQRK
jgi:hypothetical protein